MIDVSPGIYPAAVTPFTPEGEIDYVSVAKLLAWFEAAGCAGAVLAGTNGEGPSLSAIEKRDLLRKAMPLRGKLSLILGIATTSLEEGIWLAKQAAKDGAEAVLVMAPFYFKEANEEGVAKWFEELMSGSPLPVLVYNFPQRTGVTISAELLARLARHEKFGGAKDSSGDAQNLLGYKQAVGDKPLFVGNETLLFDALKAGWSGSISGAANTVPQWLSQITAEWLKGDVESAAAKFEILLPALKAIRGAPQPAVNKALLARHGVIDSGNPRLPLLQADHEVVDGVAREIKKATGFAF